MGSAIRKIGNSAGVILPKPVLETLGAKLGDTLEFITEGSVVRIEAAKRNVREGWAEASREIAAAHDDALVWDDDFSNEFDEAEWRW